MDETLDSIAQFERMVHEHHVRVRVFVRSLGVDPDWVDDIAQEAFIKAYRDWSSYDQSRDFGKWIRGIAANIVRNEIRKNARREHLLHSGLSEILANLHNGITEQKEPLTLGVVRGCLSKLSPTHHEIIQSRYRDGLKAPELAEKFQQTAANVRQMLVRIRSQLRTCVELQLKTKADLT